MLVLLYLPKTVLKFWLSRVTHSPTPKNKAPKIYKAIETGMNKHKGHAPCMFDTFLTRLLPQS